MTTINMSVERDDEQGESQEIELEITGTHNEYVPARLHCHPDNATPAEGGDTEIENVKVLTPRYAHLFTGLTEEEQERAQEELETQAENDAESAMEAAAEARAEAMYEDRFYDRDDY